MWQIINAEYSYIFSKDTKNLQWLMPFSIIAGATLFGNLSGHTELWIIALLFMGITFTLHDDNRIYFFSNLPISLTEIAFARLLMLIMNLSVVLVVSLLLISFGLIQPFKSNLAFINLFMVAIVVRLITYCLSDITIGVISIKKKLLLIFGFIIVFIIPFVMPFVIFAFITNKYGIQNIALIISIIAIPLLSYISIKTFTSKEKITVREE